MTIFTIARSSNKKTGDIPQVAIMGDRWTPDGPHAGELVAQTCQGCRRLPKKHGGAGEARCYAFGGTGQLALLSALRAEAQKGAKYAGGWGLKGFQKALKRSARTAKAVRLGMIGDPVGDLEAVREIAAAARAAESDPFDVLVYSHFWRKIKPSDAMASVDGDNGRADEGFKEADRAARAGFRVALVLDEEDLPGPGFTINGKAAILCPAQREPVGRRAAVTCNDCRLCDPQKSGPHILFRSH